MQAQETLLLPAERQDQLCACDPPAVQGPSGRCAPPDQLITGVVADPVPLEQLVPMGGKKAAAATTQKTTAAPEGGARFANSPPQSANHALGLERVQDPWAPAMIESMEAALTMEQLQRLRCALRVFGSVVSGLAGHGKESPAFRPARESTIHEPICEPPIPAADRWL